jgi:hypothetical protein
LIKSFSGLFVLWILLFGLIVSVYANKHLIEIDDAGREWLLKYWEDGSRPYPKDLKEREKWYEKKWGERWYGPKKLQRIYTPGNWKWEVYHSVPKDMAARLKGTKGIRNLWGNRSNVLTFVWAPDGQQVADVYIFSTSSFYHYNPISKTGTFIGNPRKHGYMDGVMEKALLRPHG